MFILRCNYLLSFALFCSPLMGQIFSTSNQATLASYESSIEEYVCRTTPEYSAYFNDWIDATLSFLPTSARIIEIGSAFGRDAEYIESRGFSVERTDATKGFLNLLEQKGYSASLFNILTDEFPSAYDLVFANRVFLHFTSAELQNVLVKIRNHLIGTGILAFSLKKGEGEEFSKEKLDLPRYYCYWSSKAIRTLLETSGFEVLSIVEDDRFLQVIGRKKEF